MKTKITRGTTISGGIPVNEGQIIDLDIDTFRLLKSQGQAEEAPPDPQPEAEPPKKSSKGK